MSQEPTTEAGRGDVAARRNAKREGGIVTDTAVPRTDVEDVLMGVDATSEDELEPMGSIMRLVSRAVVHAVSTGSWSPRPIALRILAVEADARSEARAIALDDVEAAVKGLDRLYREGRHLFDRAEVLAAIEALRKPE